MKLQDFVPLPESGVRVPASDAVPAGYLDGAERILLEQLQTVADRSVASPELRALMRDWATLYHLTPYRSTLFDALGFEAAGDKRVLELGAGCGAITRWLGEHCGEVHAVEGNTERARVIQARCAGLDHVQVFSANYSQLEEEGAYDIATLIGVLEYGHLYHPDTRDPREAAVANLKVAHRALRDDSVLVLAIENKLGLKYLNGAREDHSARPYDSINGYPSKDNAVCFSAREIEAMLADAGFDHASFFLPFPDYKLATTLVNDAAVRDEHHVHAWLQEPAPDRGFASRVPMPFNETLAQREVARAGLLRDLANSFLVVAYRGDVAAADERLGIRTDWVARHYSLDRRPSCRKRVTLDADGATVRHEPALGAPAGPPTALGAFEHVLGAEPHRPGELVLFGVLETLAASGVEDGFLQHVRDHFTWLLGEHGTGRVDGGAELVGGDALDALWWNLVAGPDGWHEIDREWRFRGGLPVDYVAWRNLFQFHRRFSTYLPEPWRSVPAEAFATMTLERAGLLVDRERAALFADLERAFGAAASPGPLPELPASVQALADDAGAPRFQVLARAEEIVSQPELLRAYAGAFGAGEASTLVLRPEGDAAAIVGPLREAITAAGLDEDTMPDTLLVEAADAVAPEAVLTEAAAWAPDGVPVFGGGEIAQLRTLAERHWAAAA